MRFHQDALRRTGYGIATAVIATMTVATPTATAAPPTAKSQVVVSSAEMSRVVQAGHAAVNCAIARCIALTFDGGPGPYTAQLLDVLKAERIHSTFFLIGTKVKKRPELVRRMAAEGQLVENLSWSHPVLPDLSVAQITEELQRDQDAIKAVIGRAPTLMRPPQGRSNERVSEVCRKLGLPEILWNDRAIDYRDHDTKLIEQRILNGARRNGIVLLHDIYPGTVPAVPTIIDTLRRRGYTFVTVPQLFRGKSLLSGREYRSA